jgi:hypothetical protein
MDFDDINVVGLIFALIGFGIGIIVANSMDSGLVIKLLSGVVSGVVTYFIGSKIADG